VTTRALTVRLASRLPAAGPVRLGVAAGMMSSAIVMVACWAGSFVVLPVVTGSVPAGLLGAVLAFWMLAIFALPLLVLGAAIGLILAAIGSVTSPAAGTVAGAAVGEIVLGWLLPRALGPGSGDFVAVLASPAVAAGYGAAVGALAGWLARASEGGRMPG
jgi:hypothetical protein